MCALVEARKDKHMTLLDFAYFSGVSWDAVRSLLLKQNNYPSQSANLRLSSLILINSAFLIICEKKSSSSDLKA